MTEVVDGVDVARSSLTRRAMVPSAREAGYRPSSRPTSTMPAAAAEGGGAAEPADALAAPPTAAQPRSGAVRAALTELNPWAIAKGYPVLPLLIFALLEGAGGLESQSLIVAFPNALGLLGPGAGALLFLSGVAGQGVNVAGPFLGYLADRHRIRTRFLQAGAVMEHAGSMLMGLAMIPASFLGARATSNVGQNLHSPSNSIMADYYPQEVRLRAQFFNQRVVQLTIIFGQPIAGFVILAMGWQWALILTGGLGLGVASLAFLVKEPAQGAADRAETGVKTDAEAPEPRKVAFSEAWRTVQSIRTMRRLWVALPLVYVTTIIGVLVLTGVYLAVNFGMGPQERGFVGAAGGAAGLLALVVFAPMTQRLASDQPGRLLSFAALTMAIDGVLVVALLVAPTRQLAIAAVVAMYFFAPFAWRSCLGILQVILPASVRTLGIGTVGPAVAAGVGISFAAAPLLLGVVGIFGLQPNPVASQIYVVLPLFFFGAVALNSAALSVEGDARRAQLVAIADDEATRARRSGHRKLLVCRALELHHDGAQVLFGVDLDVEEGEIVALLGTNGAGKSTVLRAVAGLHPASFGAIFFDGVDITHASAHGVTREGVVMVPGGHAIFPSLTVEENLRTAAWTERDHGPGVRERREEVLELFPILRERMGEIAGNLSGGEQQMLALGQALLLKPRLLMIDELSLGLAPQVVEDLLRLLRRVNALGTTVVLVEQSINVALSIATRAVFMEKGQVKFDGPADELLDHPELMRSVFLGAAGGGRSLGQARAARPMETESEMALEVRGVELHFGGVNALRGVDLRVRPGEVVGIVGPNGAGKTTLFDVVSGFRRPDAGVVLMAGQEITAMSPDARGRLGLSRSFQNVRLFPALTVRENILVALERSLASRSALSAALRLPAHARAERRAARRTDGLIESLGLQDYSGKFLRELSTGSRRVVDIACVLASSPKVLLLDEPTSGLAQAETEELGPFIGRVSRETGCAVVVIEHDIALISAVSDRLVAMRAGSVMSSGAPREVLEDSAVAAALIGDSDVATRRSGDRVKTATRRI
ncbi:MAG: MFS transporter [Candidatus Dormibacteria bacterium]